MTSFIAQLQRRVGRFPIELPAAAALAVAIAFLTVALPDPQFERAVSATGLGNVLSAAQPPLGTTARIVAAMALAALSFFGVWLGLRALDGKPEVSDFPAFRAADLHPDAPRRRPILAGAEFGAPADEQAAPPRRRALVSEPLPSFLAPQPPRIADLVPEPELFPTKKKRDETTETEWIANAGTGSEVSPDSVRTPSAPTPSTRPEETPATLPSFPKSPSEDFSSSAGAVRRDDDESEVDWLDLPPETAEEMSVSSLMARLESGVARHGGSPPPGAAAPSQDDLRRALGDLDRVSERRS